MGAKAPKCWEHLCTVLMFADAVGSCYWGCKGGHHKGHVVQYTTARVSGFGRAALRLAKLGFYDEALMLVRSLGEIANLFMLFALDRVAQRTWLNSDRNTRLSSFSPARVRQAIQRHGSVPAMPDKEYSMLCEISTHPVPELIPQAFNPARRATVAGHFQLAGFVLVLNHTAVLTSLIVALAARFCDVPMLQRKRIKRACLLCVRSSGAIWIEDLPGLWTKARAFEKQN